MKKYHINPIKFLFLFSFLILDGILFSQLSFEFAVPVPVEGIEVQKVDPIYFGTYESSKGAHLNYEFNDKGIFINTLNIQAISKETLRESSTYFIRNEHVFGVTEDSIPYVYQDEKYYFGVRNSIQVVGNQDGQTLYEMGKARYTLNYKSENGFVPTLIEFKQGQLYISDFDYDSEGKLFKKIKEQASNDLPNSNVKNIVLKPTLKEWQKLSLKELFPTSQIFRKL